MNLKAIFPPGAKEIIVNGLHQWDYGRTLLIQSSDLPAIVEVHFSCLGMKEAVVRTCDVTAGEALVVIPDRCLEQTSPIYAWIYVVGNTHGLTAKTVILPIIARTRPASIESIPVEISDKYTEAVSAMNAAIDSVPGLVDDGVTQLKKDLEEGELPIGKVAQATKADVADWSASAHESEYAWEAEKLADTAPAVKEAEHATQADHADRAGKATVLRPDLLCMSAEYYKLGEKEHGLYAVNVQPLNESGRYTILLSISQDSTYVTGSEFGGVSARFVTSFDGDGSRYIEPLEDGVRSGTITSIYRIADYGISFG